MRCQWQTLKIQPLSLRTSSASWWASIATSLKFFYNFNISSNEPSATWDQTSSITSTSFKVIFISLSSPFTRDRLWYPSRLEIIHLNELTFGTQKYHVFIEPILYLYCDFPSYVCFHSSLISLPTTLIDSCLFDWFR